MAEKQRTGQVVDCEYQAIQGHRVVGDVVKLREYEGVGEEDRVIQERLRDHQRPAEDRAPWIGVQDQPQERQVAVFLLRHDGDGGAVGNGREMLPVLEGGVLDLLHRRLGLLRSAVGEQPAAGNGRASSHQWPS
jgi:hypothetical protein